MIIIDNQTYSENEWEKAVEYVKSIAAKQNITNKYIAEQVGVSESTISRIFDLKFSPQLKLFFSICKTLNIKITIK